MTFPHSKARGTETLEAVGSHGSLRDQREEMEEIRSWKVALRDSKRYGNNGVSLVLRRSCWHVKHSHTTPLLPPTLHYLRIYWYFQCKSPGEQTVRKFKRSAALLMRFHLCGFPRNWTDQMSAVGNYSNTRMSAIVFQHPSGWLYVSAVTLSFLWDWLLS